MTTITVAVSTPKAAHAAMNQLYREHVKPHTCEGRAGVLIWQTESKWLREQLRKYLHGIILPAVSEQVRLPDPDRPGKTLRYVPGAWKELFKQQFGVPDSSEAMSDDEYQVFVRAVEAHVVVDLGVELPEEDV